MNIIIYITWASLKNNQITFHIAKCKSFKRAQLIVKLLISKGYTESQDFIPQQNFPDVHQYATYIQATRWARPLYSIFHVFA